MNDILANIVAVIILADDLHYRSDGLKFFGLHLLADRVKDGLDKDMDSLREAYWLGEIHALPPHTCETFTDGIDIVSSIRETTPENGKNDVMLCERLKMAIDGLVHAIEEVKRDGDLMSGTTAILDGISQKMLVAIGLIDRTLSSYSV